MPENKSIYMRIDAKMDYWPTVLSAFNSEDIEDDRLANLWDEAKGLYEDLELLRSDIEDIIEPHLYPKVADNEELNG